MYLCDFLYEKINNIIEMYLQSATAESEAERGGISEGSYCGGGVGPSI